MPRWALPVLLFGAIALAVWYWRGQPVEDKARTGDSDTPDPGYVALNSEFIQTDDQGVPSLRLRAERIERGSDGAPIKLSEPVLDYGPESGRRWQLSSRSGSFDTAAQRVALEERVVATGLLASAPALTIHTSALTVDLARQSVSSTVGVTIDQGVYRLAACKFTADLGRRSLRLEPDVMLRRNTGAWPAALLSLCGASAAASELEATAPSRAGGSAGTCADGSPANPVLESKNGGLYAQADHVSIRNVVITQCDMRVQAELAEASGIQFDDSRWRFSGQVRIRVGQGEMRAETAEVLFARGRIASAIAAGNPASFEQPGEGEGGGTRGHAGRIAYDAASNDIVLTGKAWLSVGRAEVNVERIRYNIAQRRVQTDAEGDGTDRVRITIQPRTSDKPQ